MASNIASHTLCLTLGFCDTHSEPEQTRFIECLSRARRGARCCKMHSTSLHPHDCQGRALDIPIIHEDLETCRDPMTHPSRTHVESGCGCGFSQLQGLRSPRASHSPCLLFALTLGSQSRQAPLLHRPLQSWCLQGSPLFPSHTEIISLKSSNPLAFRDPVPFGRGVRCVVCVPVCDCSAEGSRSFYLRRWAVVVFTWYVSAWGSQILVLVVFPFPGIREEALHQDSDRWGK